MHIINAPFNMGAPDRNPETLGFPKALQLHVQKFPFRTLSEDGFEHSLQFHNPEPGLSQREMLAQQTQEMIRILELEGSCCIVGGDNSICYDMGIEFFKYAERNQRPAYKQFLISFDRHPDVASPETHDALHATWLRRLVEDAGLLSQNIRLAGIGDAELEELDYLKNRTIPYDTVSHTNHLLPFYERMGLWHDAPVFISIDVDILDPAFLPCTGTPRGGGWTTRELLSQIKALRNIIRTMPHVWCITEAFHSLTMDPACVTLNTVEALLREIAS